MNYYYNIDGNTLGPLPIEQLIGIITPETLIWNENGSMPNWKPANEVSEFIELSQPKKAEENSYFYIENQISLGPLTISELINKINKNTLVWNTNGTMTEWLPAIKLDDFKPYFKNEEPQIIIPTPPSVPLLRPEDYFNFQISDIVNRRPTSGLYIRGKLLKGEINIHDVLFFSDKRQNNLELVVTDIFVKTDKDKASFTKEEAKNNWAQISNEHPLMKNLAAAVLIGRSNSGDYILTTTTKQNLKWGFNANRLDCEGCSLTKT